MIECVDCEFSGASLAKPTEQLNIYVSEETKVITNNIFSIRLKYRQKMFPNELCVVLVDKNGLPVSDAKKISAIQNQCEFIDVQLQLNAGTANGECYLLVLSQANADGTALCADKCVIDVAFSADVDFDF